jgi:hypothetical protein
MPLTVQNLPERKFDAYKERIHDRRIGPFINRPGLSGNEMGHLHRREWMPLGGESKCRPDGLDRLR